VAVDRIAARQMAEQIPGLRSPHAQDRVRLLAVAAAISPAIAPGVSHWWVLLHEHLMLTPTIVPLATQDPQQEIMAGRGGKKPVRPPSRRKPSGVAFPTEPDDLRVLLLLADSGRPIFLDELARLFPDEHVAVAAIVERLEAAGLVETQRRGAGIAVTATATGRSVRKHT
jgi:hypothetical protein